MKKYRQIIDNLPEFLDIFDLKIDKNSKCIDRNGICYNILRNQEEVGRISIFYNRTNLIAAKYEDIELKAKYIFFKNEINCIEFEIKKDNDKYIGEIYLTEGSICNFKMNIISEAKKIEVTLNEGNTMLGFKAESMTSEIYKEELKIHALEGISQYKEDAFSTYDAKISVFPVISIGNEIRLYIIKRFSDKSCSDKGCSELGIFPNFFKSTTFDDKMVELVRMLSQDNSNYYDSIHLLREKLEIGKTSLLDNFVHQFFSSFPKETLEALFGYSIYSNSNQIEAEKTDKTLIKSPSVQIHPCF